MCPRVRLTADAALCARSVFGFYDDLEVTDPDAGSSAAAKDHTDNSDVRSTWSGTCFACDRGRVKPSRGGSQPMMQEQRDAVHSLSCAWGGGQ